MKTHLILVLVLLVAAACATPLSRINGDAPTVSIPLSVDPPEAKVYLDGLYVGRAAAFTVERGGLPVTLGGHILRFEAEDRLSEIIEVVSRENARTVEIRLLPRPESPEKKKD